MTHTQFYKLLQHCELNFQDFICRYSTDTVARMPGSTLAGSPEGVYDVRSEILNQLYISYEAS